MSDGDSKKKKKAGDKNEKKKRSKKDKKQIGQYSLGEVLGKGGFGTVYKGLNTETGDFVAVKQIKTKNCSREQLESIHSEINLLKKLNNSFIVRYIDHKQTKSKLYIIIEFVENGSLQHLLKQFGKMKENMVALYIAQVLEGLRYLHSEGVIHRDIKGANVLVAAKSKVKLADFGVAAAFSDVDAENPVGTPYWMAPEIIELSPATPAADIWSVGCTVIELLSGDPPYFNLDPMPALYRIVQDEHPPLPDCSPACKDFLLECFKKDPNLRKSADKLLNHPWIKQTRRNTEYDVRPILVSQAYTSSNPTSSPVVASVSFKPVPHSEEKPIHKVRLEEPASTQDKAPTASVKPSKEGDDDDWGEEDWGDDNKKEDKPQKPTLSLALPVREVQQLKDSARENSAKKRDSRSLDIRKSVAAKPDNILLKFKEEEDDDDWGDEKDERKVHVQNTQIDQILQRNAPQSISKDEDDNWDDLAIANVDLASKLQQKLGSNTGDVDIDDDDPFHEAVENEFNEIEVDFKVTQRDLELKLQQDVASLLSQLRITVDDKLLLETCKKLIDLLSENADIKQKLVTQQCTLTILEMLHASNPTVIHEVLHLLNIIVENNTPILESLCLVGVLPAVQKFSSPENLLEIRTQTALFISDIVHASPLTLQMFIACQGIPVLVAFLIHDDSQYQERRKVILSAVNSILQVFETDIRMPKKDFIRIFAGAKLMIHLSKVLLNVLKDKEPDTPLYLSKIITILMLFSKADAIVKEHVAEEQVLDSLLTSLNLLSGENKLNILKVINNISADKTFASFDKVDVFPRLVPQLGESNEHMVHHALSTLFNMCNLNRNRQERAAAAGAIPYLQKLIRTNSPLKHLAVKIICDMSYCGRKTHQELWNNNCVNFYVELFKMENCQEKALDSLAEWVKEKEESKRVQNEVVKPENIRRLVDVFRTVPNRLFMKLIAPLQKILNVSTKVCEALSNADGFIAALANSMSSAIRNIDGHVLITELRVFALLYKYSTQPKQVMNMVYPILHHIAENAKSSLAKTTAKELIDQCDANFQL